ncbi:threonine aldolase family protein [Kineosporia babensis]|uniref:Aminotransferase class I/II-fold pyridoxal phosphate-dependent enzyme n=1 Tax=Kineosporia babensis TaxID=499548 RepID=A0A9X1NLH2_9ACTN|nr:GntG family PLP-dependent aldolase [Kineosporia babensis]MCD5315724.1 aminotransferase class I/II-fold pyridoxal phosphate-dependent enzyme [Kineosporia babensis]
MADSPPCLDFRSDTRTLPDPAMRSAMASAQVGDDVYGDDPTVIRLETAGAELLGTQKALLTPTATMANLLAVRTHASNGAGDRAPRAIVGEHSHMGFLEAEGLQSFGGIDLQTCEQDEDGVPDQEHLQKQLRKDAGRPTVVGLENTAMMHAGNAITLEQTQALAEQVHEHSAHLHLDGARLSNAAVALGCPPAALAGPADSVTFALSKGLGAPAGALLCGSEEFVEQARRLRAWLGGTMHQSGVLAAPALRALGRLPDLAVDHATAAQLRAEVSHVPGAQVLRSRHPTNLVMVRLAGLTSPECSARLSEHGVRVLSLPTGYVRFVLHRSHGVESVRRAAQALRSVAQTSGVTEA